MGNRGLYVALTPAPVWSFYCSTVLPLGGGVVLCTHISIIVNQHTGNAAGSIFGMGCA